MNNYLLGRPQAIIWTNVGLSLLVHTCVTDLQVTMAY